ncbi:MAG: UMP kinase [Candidatus Stahlbacteria bacterium]|nr:UMP kinase [Candidatus Stahlbacteria bacterium]
MYKRVLLKLSGEVLAGSEQFGIDYTALTYIANEIALATKNTNTQLAIVIGGGNIFRGAKADMLDIERVVGDYVGLLSTVINALVLQNTLERLNRATCVMSAIEVNKLAEPYIIRKAIRHLEKDKIVLLASGTGNPYFTTDTAAVLRGLEIGAEIILKGTRVDGVYSADPEKAVKHIFYKKVSYDKVLRNKLGVMDLTAITLCAENKLPIRVFNIKEKGNLKKVIGGEPIGTLIK